MASATVQKRNYTRAKRMVDAYLSGSEAYTQDELDEMITTIYMAKNINKAQYDELMELLHSQDEPTEPEEE